MTDPLMSDELASVLSVFPPKNLIQIVEILKKHRSFTPFPMRVAKNARKASPNENLAAHVEEIADEILWWASNEISRQFGRTPNWRELLTSFGKVLGVAAKDLGHRIPLHAVEGAILKKAVPDWETLTPQERAKRIQTAGVNSKAGFGLAGSLPALAINIGGRILAAAGPEMAAGATGAGAGAVGTGAGMTGVAVIAAPIVASALALAGTGYSVFELSGPSYRVVAPVALLVAITRQQLRDERNASAFSA